MRVRGVYKNNSIIVGENFKKVTGIKNGTPISVEIKLLSDFVEVKKWNISEDDMQDLTPIKVRNLLIRCFTYAHMEEVYEKKSKRQTYGDYEIVRQSIKGEIEITFKQIEADYNNPTRFTLSKVLDMLSKKQINRNMSSQIINHHKSQLQKAINRL